MKSRKRRIQEFCGCISLRDKSLIIFMIVLMTQLAISLFLKSNSSYAPSVNIVIRTTISAIFGYFISSNFVSRRENNKKMKNDKDAKAKIKCICELEELEEDIEEEQRRGQQTEDKVQIIIITAIGLISLLIVCFSLNLKNLPEDALVTLSQYRSLISGCVGFLIGIPSEKNTRR